VDIEEIGLLEIIGGELGVKTGQFRHALDVKHGHARYRRSETYLSEVDFVEDHLIRVVDAPEAGYEGQSGDDSEGDSVTRFRIGCGRFLARFGDGNDVRFSANNSAALLLGRARNAALAQASLRSRHGGGRLQK